MSQIDPGSRTVGKFDEFVGPLARSLYQLGVPRRNLLDISHRSPLHKKDNGFVIVELDGDWLSDAKNVEEGRYSSPYEDRKRDDLYKWPAAGKPLPAPSGPGTPFSSKIPHNALRFLGLQNKTSSSSQSQRAQAVVASAGRGEGVGGGVGGAATTILSSTSMTMMRPGQLKHQTKIAVPSPRLSSSSSSMTASSAAESGSSSSSSMNAKSTYRPRPAVAYEPLAQAMPISIIALCQVSSRAGVVSLPSPSNFSDDPERNTYLQNRFAERTGIRPAHAGRSTRLEKVEAAQLRRVVSGRCDAQRQVAAHPHPGHRQQLHSERHAAFGHGSVAKAATSSVQTT